MKCPKCQSENPATVKFCGECGTKLEFVCPQCRSENPPEFKFCGQCGASLTTATTTVAQAKLPSLPLPKLEDAMPSSNAPCPS